MPEHDKEGVLATLKSMAIKALSGKTGSEADKGIGLTRPVTKEMESYDRIAVRHDRIAKIKDCQKMVAIDPRVSRLLYKLSSDARVGGFTVRVEQAATDSERRKAQNIIDQINTKCKVFEKLKGWMKGCLRDGDLYLEVVVDDPTHRVTRLKKLAAIITFSNMNSEGNFPDNKPAFYQEHPWTREQIRTFEQWQIVHIPWDAEDGRPYGDPMFKAARLAYERLDLGEKNLVVRRGIRAGSSRHHQVGTEDDPGNWEDVEEYKKFNKDTLDNPMSPAQDFYSNGRVTIEELKGDTTLGEISDIEHFEGLVVSVTGVPYAFLGGGRESGINRDVLEEQQEDYYKVIEDVNGTMEQGLSWVYRFGLLLQGMNDESIKLTFNWGAKDRTDVDAKIARAKELQSLGFSFQTIFTVVDLDEIELEEEMERIRRQVEEGIVPYGLGMKLDPTVVALLGLISQTKTPETGEELAEQVQQLRIAAERMMNEDKGSTVKQLLNVARQR